MFGLCLYFGEHAAESSITFYSKGDGNRGGRSLGEGSLDASSFVSLLFGRSLVGSAFSPPFRFEIFALECSTIPGSMSSLSRELVFLILQFLDEEKFKDAVHK